MDLFSLTRASQPVHVFRTEEELRRYTIETGKFFPKEEAYAGGLLKYMLRQITGTYNGKRGMSKKTGGQGMDRGRGKNWDDSFNQEIVIYGWQRHGGSNKTSLNRSYGPAYARGNEFYGV